MWVAHNTTGGAPSPAAQERTQTRPNLLRNFNYVSTSVVYHDGWPAAQQSIIHSGIIFAYKIEKKGLYKAELGCSGCQHLDDAPPTFRVMPDAVLRTRGADAGVQTTLVARALQVQTRGALWVAHSVGHMVGGTK